MTTPTPSQTIGPFWHGLADPALADLARGEPSRALTGTITDGAGALVTDACVELWQPEHRAWGRCATDAAGRFAFTVCVAPAISVAILARGLLLPVWTRVYFEDTGDALLASLPPERRATLLARPDGTAWRWDVTLQGRGETVFLALR